jgi:hypothetical protein
MAKKKDKDANAVALGRKGGKARRNKLTPARISQMSFGTARKLRIIRINPATP